MEKPRIDHERVPVSFGEVHDALTTMRQQIDQLRRGLDEMIQSQRQHAQYEQDDRRASRLEEGVASNFRGRSRDDK